jgi:hypothetical protein
VGYLAAQWVSLAPKDQPDLKDPKVHREIQAQQVPPDHKGQLDRQDNRVHRDRKVRRGQPDQQGQQGRKGNEDQQANKDHKAYKGRPAIPLLLQRVVSISMATLGRCHLSSQLGVLRLRQARSTGVAPTIIY